MSARHEVKIGDGRGGWIHLKLATGENGRPLFDTGTLNPLQPTTQIGEASYAAFLPRVGGVYAQPDLSGGLGRKFQVPIEHPDFNRYWYAERMDWSVPGQGQKGPAVTTLTAPANSGTLTGYFELAGVPYLVLSRKIASWASDTLTEVFDMGGNQVLKGAATYYTLGSESSIEANTGDTGQDDIQTADARVAQQVRSDDTGVRFLARVDCKLVKTASPTGDVRLSVYADVNGQPGGSALVTARRLASGISTSAAGYTFRFDDDEVQPYAIVYNEPFWLVLDVAGADSANYISWRRDAANGYTRGSSATSADGGNSWTTSASNDYFFSVYAKSITPTAFVGRPDVSGAFRTTTDGATYTADTYRQASLFCVVGGYLVRDVWAGDGDEGFTIQRSVDGKNWEESIVIGSAAAGITNLLALGSVLIVCKEDSIWAVDISATPVEVAQLHGTGLVSVNGLGACVWKDAAFIPMDGRLMAVQGDFSNGFTVHTSIGIESLPEWDWPWGSGRHVACRGDRFHLYSAVSTSGGYRLLKASNPLKKTADGKADPDWHGSLATIGDGTQTLNFLAIFDPGGTGSPQLFATTTSNDVARITLPRTANPAGDSSYRYDISAAGSTYYPYAHGNFPVHPKAWLREAATLGKEVAGDFVDVLYDTLDGNGYRRFSDRLYRTGTLRYPTGLGSRLLGRQLVLTNSAATASPLIVASGLSFAVRSLDAEDGVIRFAVEADDGLSGRSLGDALGLSGAGMVGRLEDAATGAGTRPLVGPDGTCYESVLFLDAEPKLLAIKGEGTRRVVEVSAVRVG